MLSTRHILHILKYIEPSDLGHTRTASGEDVSAVRSCRRGAI